MDAHSTDQSVVALAGLRQFLLQPRSAQTLRLLQLVEVGRITKVTIEDHDDVEQAIAFDLKDARSQTLRCRCNPAAFALLLLVVLSGQSVFIDYAGDKPYVKVFGRKSKSAGTVFARFIVGAEAKEDFTYSNGDSLDLTHANIKFRCVNPRTANHLAESFAETLVAVLDAPEALFPGTADDKRREVQHLLQTVLDRISDERLASVSV